MSMPRLNPLLRGFACLRCGTAYPIDDYFEGCPACSQEGHASSLVASYGASETESSHRLPLLDVPWLGQGDTPLLPLPEIAETLEMDGAWLKAEGQNPTGSHKDRMSALIVARAQMLGARRVLAASSGNAGVSLAAFAARTGLKCAILSKEGQTGTWSRDMVDLGAELSLVSTQEERWTRMAEWVRQERGYPATNYLTPPVGSNPFGVQGYKEIGYELARDLVDERLDAVIVPTARGDLLWGIWEGLREVTAAERRPKMIAVDPFPRTAKALAGEDYRGTFPGTSAQIAIASNTVTWQTLHTLRASGGTAVEVDDDEAAAARAELARRGNLLELCSAAPLVALRKLRASGVLGVGSRAVLVGSSDGRRENPFG